jgi:hypothetical protein
MNILNKAHMHTGMTLIEIILYICLLSVLLSGFISYAYGIHMQNSSLLYDIENSYN